MEWGWIKILLKVNGKVDITSGDLVLCSHIFFYLVVMIYDRIILYKWVQTTSYKLILIVN